MHCQLWRFAVTSSDVLALMSWLSVTQFSTFNSIADTSILQLPANGVASDTERPSLPTDVQLTERKRGCHNSFTLYLPNIYLKFISKGKIKIKLIEHYWSIKMDRQILNNSLSFG